eukprot:gene4854-5322_t
MDGGVKLSLLLALPDTATSITKVLVSMGFSQSLLFGLLALLVCLVEVRGFVPSTRLPSVAGRFVQQQPQSSNAQPAKLPTFGAKLIQTRQQPLRDLLGLGPVEIGLTLLAALVLFGPETLKSLSKDVGRAAAELKEIPKTFKEGMDEGAESAQVSRMKAIAAEKRKKREEKLQASGDDDEEADESAEEVKKDK